MAAPLDPPLDSNRHIRYWKRCFGSVLPHHYTSNDSIRLTLGFFVLAALDLLSSASSYSTILEDPAEALRLSLITPADRPRLRAWVLSHQHPHGGFCGSPHHVFPASVTTRWDFAADHAIPDAHANANVAATYFSLLALGILADADGGNAFEGVDRVRTLKWLRKLQRDDGSFGEAVSEEGYVAGGRDTRYCYLAATIRWALGGNEKCGGEEENLDFNVEALVSHIRRSQFYDGGMGEGSFHESHAGYAYCAVACLSMLDQANQDSSSATEKDPYHYIRAGIPSIPSLTRFLISRQYVYLNPPSSSPGDGDQASDEEDDEEDPLPDLAPLSLNDDPHYTNAPCGFNGRLNKVADTCYTWWVTGALALLPPASSSSSPVSLVDRVPARNFLLSRTQHLIGGFGKHAGSPPDVYHAYLGLAALGVMADASADGKDAREDGLGHFDARLCLGLEASQRVRAGRDALLQRERTRVIATEVEQDNDMAKEEKEAAERAREMLKKVRTWAAAESGKEDQKKNPVFDMDRFVVGKTMAPF